MPRLPVVSGRELIRALSRLGYEVSRTRGSHTRLDQASAASYRSNASTEWGQEQAPDERVGATLCAPARGFGSKLLKQRKLPNDGQEQAPDERVGATLCAPARSFGSKLPKQRNGLHAD